MMNRKFVLLFLFLATLSGALLTTALFLSGEPTLLAGPSAKGDRTIEWDGRTALELGSLRTLLRVGGQEYEAWMPEGATVHDLMVYLQDNRDFRFRGKRFPGIGFFVEEINGLRQDPKAGLYWIYYVNGETALVGVSQYIIQPHDIIEWRYEAEQ